MNQTPNIIKYRNEYWVSFQYALDNLGVSMGYLVRQLEKRESEQYRKTKYNGIIYIAVNSVPKKHLLGNDLFFDQCHVQVWDANILRLQEDFRNACYYSTELCNEAWYEYESGLRINRQKAKEIDQYGNILLQSKSFEYWKYNVSATEFFEQVCIIGRELCPLFKFKNPRSLYPKLKEMPTDKEALKIWLIPGSFGNQSARVWGRDENKLVNRNTGEIAMIDIHERIAFYYWINPGKGNKLNKRQVYDYYKDECQRMGLTPVSLSTMKAYINKKRMFLSLERDGSATFNDKHAPYIPAERLKYSGSQWNADYSGTKLGYLDENGKVKTLQVLRIIDTHSGKWLAFSCADRNESQETTLEGFKKAIEPLSKTAFELVTDNGGAFTGGEIALRLSKLFVKHRKIELGNKQANPAENFVRRVTEFSRDLDNWIMLGFSSSFGRTDSRANEDYSTVGILKSKAAAIEQLEHLQQRWNDEKDLYLKKTRNEAFEQHQHPDLPELSHESRFFAFANHTEVNISECRGIVNIQKNYQEHKFQFNNFETALETISKYCNDQKMKVIVAYNANEAHVYSLKGDYIMPLEKARLSHKSFAEMTRESAENFENHQSRKHHFKKHATEYTEQVGGDEFELPYMIEVKANGEGKQHQEAMAEHRVEVLKNSAKQNMKNEDSDDEDDNDDFIREFMLKNM